MFSLIQHMSIDEIFHHGSDVSFFHDLFVRVCRKFHSRGPKPSSIVVFVFSMFCFESVVPECWATKLNTVKHTNFVGFEKKKYIHDEIFHLMQHVVSSQTYYYSVRFKSLICQLNSEPTKIWDYGRLKAFESTIKKFGWIWKRFGTNWWLLKLTQHRNKISSE